MSSFTDTVRSELTRGECSWPCCALAELSANLLLTGGVAFRGRGRYGLTLSTEHNSVSRYYFAEAKKHLGVTCEIRTLRIAQLGERTRYELVFPDERVGEVMEKLCLSDESALFGVRQTPAKEILSRGCCRAAFLKSAFLSSGSVSRPEKEYALAISAGSREMAEAVAEVMRSFDLSAGVSPRKAQFVAYLKGAEDISAFLTVIGAHSAVLSLENTRIIKDFRNQANRLANCDSNNIERTLRSAQSQIEDIELVIRSTDFEKLPPNVREIAYLRLNEPNATLTELGEMCQPPIGKSGVNNRLRRISEMARIIREGE